MYTYSSEIWSPLSDNQLEIVNGGSLLSTVLGVGSIVIGVVAIVGAVVATIYCPAAYPATGKLALAGVAAVVAGAKILGY